METTLTKFLTLLLLHTLPLSAVNPWLPQTAQQRGQGVRIKVENNQEVDLYKASYALIIGVSDYTNGWPKLPGVKRDVTEVSAVLREHGFAITTVNNPARAQLDQALRKFINDYGQDRDNRLLIYFAGHGHTIETVGGQQGYIVPADAPDPNRYPTAFKDGAISMDEIDSYVRRIDAKHVLWLFDSCFSGSLFEATRAIPPAITSRTARPVRQFITAGTAEQRVPDNSVFRAQFVAGLRGEADRDKDGFITGDELGLYLKDSVTNYTRQAQEPQYGKIRNPNLDKGDFVFSLARKTTMGVTNNLPSGEEAWYREIQNSADVAELEAFVKAHPNGQYGRAINARIRRLQKNTTTANNSVTSPVSGSSPHTEAGNITSPKLSPLIALPAKVSLSRLAVHNFITATVDKNSNIKRFSGTPTQQYTENLGKGVRLEMIAVKGGTLQGKEPAIISDFWIGKFEVTQMQWRTIMGNNSSKFKGDNLPVDSVSWDAIQLFCRRLNSRLGLSEANGYRLPTETEWEYAARAGSHTKYAFGDTISPTIANYNFTNGPTEKNAESKAPEGFFRKKTIAVGSLGVANAWGIFDMDGNLWEWCSDGAGVYDVGTPSRPRPLMYRMNRGCSWYNDPKSCETGTRVSSDPRHGSSLSGFRLVR